MNETVFYRKTIQKYAASDAAVKAKACAPVERKGYPWKRVLLPVAACLVLLCGTVLVIPSARAEVLSWFRGNDPGEYL
ncbi:MAG: hypothetical protein IKI52_01910, partial [Clostridia bacterium]|nr:hypothetical protein [Clostridia bacterium]